MNVKRLLNMERHTCRLTYKLLVGKGHTCCVDGHAHVMLLLDLYHHEGKPGARDDSWFSLCMRDREESKR